MKERTYCEGGSPPSSSAMACREYGICTSSTVLDAPLTHIKSATASAPPPGAPVENRAV